MENIEEKATDKTFLRTIVEDKFKLPAEIDEFTFARALMANLGDPDQEIRDELSYMILARGIIDQQKLNPEQTQMLLQEALDDKHLFYHIGETGTDAVFMRSFSNLVIAAILYNETVQATIEESLIKKTKYDLLRYALEEKDKRGYIEGKGWAHAMAHLADALDECAQHPVMNEEDRIEILNSVARLATAADPLYQEEDARLANIAYHIALGKQVNEEALGAWINTCVVERDEDVVSWARATNARNFLRSLYFFLYWDNISPVLAIQILNLLKQQEELYIDKNAAE